MTPTLRLFFAVDATALAPQLLALQQQWLTALADQKAKAPSRAVAVAPENLHMTLLFLGNLTQAQCDNLILATTAARLGAQLSPFSVTLCRSGLFPSAKVAWLGPATTPEPLTRLEQQLRALVSELGLAVEPRPYRPHITLLRKTSSPANQDLATALAPPPAPLTLPVNEFALYESRSTPDGVRYLPLASWQIKNQ